MGLNKGSVTCTRYKVGGRLPEGFKDFLDQAIRSNLFLEIDDTADEQSVGWVSPYDFLDTKLEYAAYALDPYVALGLRVDRRRVPGAILNKYWRLEMDKAKAMRDGRALARHEREELKEKAHLRLMTRIPPATSFSEMCWDTARGEVILYAAAKSTREIFEDLFHRSFDLNLIPLIPYLLAQDLLPAQGKAALEQAQPLGLAHQEG
jgi:DNA recombination-dependent growth factor C